MSAIRDLLLRRFSPNLENLDTDETLGWVLEPLLWTIEDLAITPDGWTLFRISEESPTSLKAIGLMSLLPSGSIPIQIDVEENGSDIRYSVIVAKFDENWVSLSDSKRWNSVYLYALGEREVPAWTWAQQYNGSIKVSRG